MNKKDYIADYINSLLIPYVCIVYTDIEIENIVGFCNKIKNNAIKKVGNKKTTDKVKIKNNRIKILPPNDVKLMDVIKEINLFEEQENKSGASARAKRV